VKYIELKKRWKIRKKYKKAKMYIPVTREERERERGDAETDREKVSERGMD
jgi:hypothetical protein